MTDHRQLGRALGLFTTDERLGAGLPIWLPAGAALRQELERFIVDQERRAGYQHVYTPALARRELYEQSGHWTHYAQDMFPPMRVGDAESVLRPMNCPHHALVFDAAGRSYRDLPMRIAELGAMYRAERSGVVGGLSRVRAMTLNDGHVFCTPEQVTGEITGALEMIAAAYAALGITARRYRLSLRGGGGKYVDDAGVWERSEAMLRAALDRAGVRYEEAPGEAAFYGPKLDVQVCDDAGREETLSTVQVDLVLPQRLGLSYTGPDGRPEVPVMVHRSVIATMERVVAHLIEVYDGAFPAWLAPVQVAVLPVGVSGDTVRDRFAAAGVRTALEADGTLGARVRRVRERRIPFAAVVGAREAAAGTVSLRARAGGQQGEMALEDAVAHVTGVIAQRA